MSLPGYATPKDTQDIASRFQAQYIPHSYQTLGRTDLMVSRLGFGTYRCHQEIPAHQEALTLGLHKGCNLLDTAANYTDGNSEMLIGDILNQEIVWGELKRENLVIVSKAGYIQGENMILAQEREKNGQPFPEVIKLNSGLWHCIHPEFIEDQLTRSLSRMHLDTLDVYLLHNPEYFLNYALQQKNIQPEIIKREFYDRIRRAFIQLEKLAAEGLIRYYGISSNRFPLPGASPAFISLSEVWRAYLDACLQSGLTASEGHFAVIQFPFNWLESAASTLKNNRFENNDYTVIELAQHLELGILKNRPLNAITQEGLFRLSDSNHNANPSALSQLHELTAYIKARHPGKSASLSLAQQALLFASHTPGVVLNGMRTSEYVNEAMAALEC